LPSIFSANRTLTRPLPAEVSLAVACCSWPPGELGDARIRSSAPSLDWTLFDAVVRRNRITPLVHHALKRTRVTLPEAYEHELTQRALATARRSLVMAAESLRLQRELDAAGLRSMIVKGVPLGILAFGDCALKESADIDVLVAPDSVAEAGRLLLGLGYEIVFPTIDLADFVGHGREAIFIHPHKRITTELHWQLIDHRGLHAELSVDSPAQDVALAGGSLRTLADGPMFAFLCLHGTAHNWSRLKWLADLSAFAATRPPRELEGLFAATDAYHAKRSASVALLLCKRLMNLSLSDSLRRSIEANSVTRALQRNVFAGLAYRGGGQEHVAYSMPWVRMMVAQFFAEPGLTRIAEQIRILWTLPTDRGSISLPRQLTFVYHLLRLPLWIGRIAQRSIERRGRRKHRES